MRSGWIWFCALIPAPHVKFLRGRTTIQDTGGTPDPKQQEKKELTSRSAECLLQLLKDRAPCLLSDLIALMQSVITPDAISSHLLRFLPMRPPDCQKLLSMLFEES